MTEAQKFTKIDDRIYIIDGKPIEFRNDPYDMDDPKNKADVIDFASKLYEGATLPRIYGKTTVCRLFYDKKDPGNLVMGQVPFSKLPQTAQEKIKAIMGWD